MTTIQKFLPGRLIETVKFYSQICLVIQIMLFLFEFFHDEMQQFLYNYTNYFICQSVSQDMFINFKVTYILSTQQTPIKLFIYKLQSTTEHISLENDVFIRLGPARDVIFALIISYPVKNIYSSYKYEQFAIKSSNLFFDQIDLIVLAFCVR